MEIGRLIPPVFVLVAAFSLSQPARAGLIVDQQPDPFGGPGSDLAFRDRFNVERWQQSADNILLNSSAIVRRVVWWGFYGGSGTPVTPPPIEEAFRIRFYESRAADGLPGSVFYEGSYQNPSRLATGRFISVAGSPLEYVYQVDLDSALGMSMANPYWIEIVQLGDITTAFRWERAVTGSPPTYAFIHDQAPNWQQVTGNLAFQLSDVPEPSLAGLVVLWSLVLRWRNGSRKGGFPRN